MATPVIVDASNILKRCIIATAEADRKAKIPFNGGIGNTLAALSRGLSSPELYDAGPVFVVYDGDPPAKRFEAIPTYKEKRGKHFETWTDEERHDAFAQIVQSTDFFTALGAACVFRADYEADDVIYSAARLLAAKGHMPVVISNDHDVLQVVHLSAAVFDIWRPRWVDANTFAQVTGVPPDTYVTYRVLSGDQSDSVPGCPGCGVERSKDMIVEAVERFPKFGAQSPADQLALLKEMIESKSKRRKFEQSYLDNYETLRQIEGAVNMAHFEVPGLEEELLSFVPAFDMDAYLAECRKRKLRTGIINRASYTTPFKRAAEKRL